MSINAINSISLYEYYYNINAQDKKKKNSPLLDELKKYNITPTDSEEVNIALLKRAKLSEVQEETPKETSKSDRPWADLMYQLNLEFNEDPKEDIKDIKEELLKLTDGIDDKELQKEVDDLISYSENMYINYLKNNLSTDFSSNTLTTQLNNLSMVNKIEFL